jgi:hypothetical protein
LTCGRNCRNARLGHLALLRLDGGEARDDRARRDRGFRDRAGEAHERQLALQLGDVALVRDAPAREVRRVLGGRELAVLLELRGAGDGVDHRLPAHEHVGAPELARDQALGDEALEHQALRFGGFQHRGVDGSAEDAAHLFGEFAPRNFHSVHRGDGVARSAELRIGLDAPGGEGDRDQPEENLDDALILGDEIEHS